MFTIDFLKNEGLPKKANPLETAVFTGIAVVSLLLLCLLCTQSFYNTTVLRSRQKALGMLETMQQSSSGQGGLKSRIEESLIIYDECYFEIASSIGRYVQWTPVLMEFAEALPPSMLLNKLNVIRTIKKKKITSIRDPKKKVDIEIINRMLQSDVHDFMSDAESTAVENYLDNLRNSQVLKEVLDKVYIVKSKDAEYKDSAGNSISVRNHIIHCLLKSQEIAGTQ